MTTAERDSFYSDGELAGDDHLVEVTRVPFWRRAIDAAREINAEATRNQKVELLAIGLGSALVGATVSLARK